MRGGRGGLLASFEYQDAAVAAVEKLRDEGFDELRVYVPYPDHDLEHALGYGQSPVRVFTLIGGLTGAATGFAFTSWTSMDWPLVTGGKPILSIPAYVVIAFELTVLFGAFAAVIGLFINARLPKLAPAVFYDPDFSAGRYGVHVRAEGDRLEKARAIFAEEGASELRDDGEGGGT